MQKKLVYLLIGLVILTFGHGAFAGQYSPAWQEYLASHAQDQMVGAVITMADQVDLRALQDHLYAIHADRQLWHQTVMLALQDKATTTQADILAQLADLQAQGQVSHYKGLWLGNVIVVNATPAVFDLLANRSDVLRVSPDYQIQGIEPVDQHGGQPTIASVENGLKAIGADSCWAIGITGDGRIVSHLDTGVDGNHVALAARWRGVADSRYALNPEWAWYDPVTNTDFPFDSGAHGTHTMGTMCGLGAGTGDTVGVAFGAQWISAGVIDRVSIPRTVQDALTAFEWIADPDGDPGTVWDVPDVCSNSWGLMPAFGYPMCDETFWTVLDDCEAAGVVVNFAAGNEGPTARSLRSPADRATTDTKSFAVGAVDGNQFPDCPIADFSSRGPSDCNPDQIDVVKPEVSAPGVNVRSCAPGNGYQYMSGTSMATPHVSGAVALMRQANPNLSAEQVHTILMETAVDKGAPGEDNTYGAGVINVYQAVLRAFAYLQGWGTLAGTVTDQGSGNPIQGARITILNRTPQLSVTTNVNGVYHLFAPADTLWNIRVEAVDHLPIFDNITVTENDTLIRDYALEGKVPVTITASFGNPVDVDYRSFFIKGSWDADGFWNSGWTGPLIEIKDDGVAPDAVAGDGIFTGRVLLARDMVNTYSWGIYSENYNGNASHLQNGATFVIHALTPVTVPTLSVNPSGSDHNWDVAAVGNMPQPTLNLTRGADSKVYRWSGVETLFVGVEYVLRFKVMHSDSASYGQNGVGSADIHFIPDVTGPYEFRLDDHLDSHGNNDPYIIQLAGTEGPPTYPSARSGLDGHIPVSWLPPGTVESQTLRYDDGTLVNAYYYYAYDAIMAEMFEPTGATTIDSIMVHTLTNGDPYWPWPDGNHDPVGLSIWLDDGSGMPEADPVFYGEAASEGDGLDIKIDVPEVASSGNFWVGMQNLSGYGYEGIGLDATTDYPGNKWSRFSGAWGLESNYDGDHMIYCRVFGGTSPSSWLGANPTPAGLLSANIPVHSNPKATHGTGNANPALSATKMGHNQSIMSYHPQSSPVAPPIIANAQYVGFHLYRDIAANPWDRRPGTRVDCDPWIVPLNYDDWVKCGNAPADSINNGVLYYYQVSAVYDIGGGQYVNVGPSDQVTGMAQNHPPANPQNLAFSINGHDVTLTWDLNTDYDIYQYRIFRKDYGAHDFHLTGTVNHAIHSFTENVPVDGIYTYKVAAVDAEGMQSAGYSNGVNVPIGTIPPRNMKASTNLEFKIHAKWDPPGTGGRLATDIGPVLIVAADDATQLPGELMAYGDVESVDYFDARYATPTLDDLAPYARVISWSNYVFSDPVGMGDVLADYAEGGGGVILMQFDFGAGWGLSGRIMDQYSPFNQGPTQYFQNCLGDYDPSACAMEGITDVCELFQASVSLVNNGELIASFQDGTPFVAKSPDAPVYAINGYVGDARQFTGQMIDLVHNTLNCFGIQIQPDNYKLYKASAPGGPFNLLQTLPGDQTSFDDMPVPNGVPYWYRATAVFAGQGESDPTDTARGMGMNYPPIPPYNLRMDSVRDRDVYLTWQFDNPMGDFDHYNVERKLLPAGAWGFLASTTLPNYHDVIPPGADGVYGYRVRAVDNGTPPLEGDPSNTVFAPVGNLPPNNLRATSGEEFVVPLHWSVPGLLPDTLIQYDDGMLANASYFYDYTNVFANQFVAAPGVQLDTINIHVLTDGDPFWPWPDPTHDPIMVMVWDDNGSGQPGDMVFSQETVGEPGLDVKVAIEGGLILNGPSFWIAMTNEAGGGEEGQGLDAYTDYPQYMWYYLYGSWTNAPYNSGDQMIRADIVSGGRSIQLTEKTPTIGLALGDANAKTAESIKAKQFMHHEGLAAVATNNPMPGLPSKGLRISVAGPNDGIRPLNTEDVEGYNIYKGTFTGFPHDPAHLLRGWQAQGVNLSYPDSDVINGDTYYYAVTAEYHNGNNDEESPPSNEAFGTPANHPPANPLNLTFSVNGHDVTLNWDQNTERDMAQYLVYRKDYGQQDFHLTGTVNYPTHTFTENVPVDGIYQYEVAAKDNGNPPLQSVGFSNKVVVVIGTIPPRNMRASTNLEFKIHCKWDPPGIGRAVTDIGPTLLVQADEPSTLPDDLMAYGDVQSVDVFDARYATPTMDDLAPYSSVICWSNYVFADNVGMGDVLADYVDAGGSVLLMQFDFGQGWGLMGRIMDSYSPFSGGGTQYFQNCLGDFDASECVMDGITDVCDIYQASVSIVNNGVLIASFQDGTPFVARNPDVRVYAINGYPGVYRQFTGQMLDLIHNALNCNSGLVIPPDQYKLYKATVPGGPFALLQTLPGDQKSYDDMPVPNGVPYWYRVTAIFAGVESQPTDTARGMGMNYPPIPPYNCTATVNGRVITLTWQFDNPMGDFDHYNMYKKTIPGGSWVFAGSRTVPNGTITIPSGEDGVYGVAVTAVDNGTPQLESDKSNTAFAPVGNLPPINLRATSNQENQVPLHWAMPGLLPDTLIQYDDGMLANGSYFYDYTNVFANQFVAEPGVQLDTINIHVLTDGDPFWPWPDPTHDPIMVMVWDDDGSGNPGDMVFSQETVGEPGLDIKVPIEGGLMLNGPSFWIAFTNEAGGGEEGQGLDAYTDYPQFMWYYLSGTWTNAPYNAGDQMIRASIVSQGRSIQLTEKTPTIELALNKKVDSSKLGTTGKCATALTPSGLTIKPSKADVASIAAKADVLKPNEEIRPADIQDLLGFAIYRSIGPNVPIDDQHRIRTYQQQGLDLSYIDPNVTNGVQYCYKVTAVYNNPPIEESPGSNEACATPMLGGRFTIDPASFDLYCPSHGSVLDTMTISNTGGLEINYTILAQVENSRVLADLSRTNWSFITGLRDTHPVLDKSHPAPTNPPVIAGSGGPDAYGYSWIDSDEPGGPAVNWIDIEGIGQVLPVTGDDQTVGPFDIGFDFPFYGNPFSSFYVCSNGWISFTNSGVWLDFGQLPDPTYPENLISPFCVDLYLPSGGAVWFYSDGNQAIISWDNVPHYSSGGPYSFQMVLQSNGFIQYNYLDLNDPLNDNTIGWQNGDGSDGWTIVANGDYIHSNMTINISAGWLSAAPASGAVAPGGSGIIGVLADATLLADGHYHGTLTVNVYDINHQVGSQVVPVTFNPGFEAPVNCPYTPGDINGNHSVNGVDIVYAVNYLTGRGGPPPIDCFSYCQGTPNPFYAAGDVNGNCAFNGIDITFFVRYLKLQVPNLLYCPGCPPPPPALSAPPAPPVPAVMPKLAPRITIQKHQSGQ